MTVETSTELSDLTGAWDLDPMHTVISFAARHAMVATVRGRFRDFTGVLSLDAEDHSRSTAEVTIQTASIDSGVQPVVRGHVCYCFPSHPWAGSRRFPPDSRQADESRHQE